RPEFALRNFRTIYLESVGDQRLSWKAKGLHIYLMTRPPGWKIRHKDLENRAQDGKSSLQTAVNELRECGYLKIERLQDGAGKLVGSQWIVTESPISLPLENQPYPLFPDAATSGEPVSGKSVSGESGSVVSIDSTKQNPDEEDEHLPSDKPRETIQKEDLTRLTEHFAEKRGVRPRGKAWLPIQQGMRAMVIEEGYTVGQVVGCMDRLAVLGWDWTIATLRRWIADYVAGAMPSDNGDRARGPGGVQRAGGHDPAIYAFDDAAGQVWAVVLETMKAEISYSSFETWFEQDGAVPFELSDGCLKIAVSNPFTKGGIERRYRERIEEIATKQRGEPTTLVIEIGQGGG
ncbi:unnamed protein product, partial [marine sediment metagenome]